MPGVACVVRLRVAPDFDGVLAEAMPVASAQRRDGAALAAAGEAQAP